MTADFVKQSNFMFGNTGESKMKKLVVLLLAVVITLAACQAAKSIPEKFTSESLVGIWAAQGFLQFNDDGTFSLAGSFEEAPRDYGEYELIGTTLSLHSSENSFDCPGLHGSYELWLTEEGRLHLTLLEDTCFVRKAFLQDSHGRID